MAIVKNDKAVKKTGAGTAEMKKADAFLNVKVIGPDGKTYTLGRGLPLYADGSRLERSLINASVVDHEKQFQLVGTVHVVPSEEAGDIAL